ncbi:Coenzyme F420 hydrogenase/dehydrogenase, beta subunit C-terminal domain [Phocaeicola barnesiae]|uniref:Coenzyme F420 hydrogenase/dehydrogenase, beta subunit C-terminal domain n=1 Tax=Phocaeicola barnesiae TaxID=376804 RepID=UPI0025A4AD03|nr:Coenzyme F420 hydrogenase/dehydrogenase, beta subunit C-terminal domain [Phocaeicola barnesiae]MDM8240785.1 Coenzyme F420 hydrogenase/dehydrogenase, beta subunit C-terminal domain [Phocaeicola barnesiae]
MIHLASLEECTGCSVCLQVCPHQAITMVEDNEGFMQPEIDKNKCIECGLCVKKCPQLTNNLRNNKTSSTCYAAYSYIYQKNGSSGGMFSAIANYILKNKGIVYGAAFNENLKLKHIGVMSETEMQPLRGSKYVQSDLNHTFKEVKKHLENNTLVLYSGTPCQIDGLLSFLGKKEYNNLITIDLICHGVPSQKAFDKWIQEISKKIGDIKEFQFRKLDGWSTVPRVTTKNGKILSLRYDMEAYMWAFYKGYLFRKCCYNCKYANINHPADITLADFWGIGNYGTVFKPDQTHGISLVLTNSTKGEEVINSLNNIYIEKRALSEALNEQHNLKEPSFKPKVRDTSAIDFISEMSLLEFSKKYKLLPRHKRIYIITCKIKDTLIDYGFFDIIKELKNKVKRKI